MNFRYLAPLGIAVHLNEFFLLLSFIVDVICDYKIYNYLLNQQILSNLGKLIPDMYRKSFVSRLKTISKLCLEVIISVKNTEIAQ